MRIISLQAENIKRLKAIEIKPKGNMVLITGKNDQGKQQPVSEPILTPQGWRPIGELKIGEYVIGSDGKSTKIIGIYPQKERKTFMVKMTDGASTRCGPEHLWNVSSWKSVSGNIVWFPEIISTTDLLAKGLRHGSARKWSVPIVNPIEFSDSGEELPINPYALGIILGDGHIEPTGYVTITSGDSEIFDTLNIKGWRAEKELGTGAWSRPLRHLGLAGILSYGKFIPEVYQYASIEDRKLLFFGLMDSDGTSEASWASYCSTSECLVDDIVQLGSSLGYFCKKRRGSTKKYRYNGELKEGRMAWYVLIKSPEAPFTLERKIAKWSPSIARPAKRFIDTITQVDSEDSVCIKIAAKNGLYVTKDFILTHNTSVLDSIWFALAGKDSMKDTPRPIRKGQNKAKVTVDLGDMVVTRTWTADNVSYLKVETAEGHRVRGPQELIDKFIGKLSFDPLEFTYLKPAEQRQMLLDLIDVEIDLDELERDRQSTFDARTEKNRELKILRAQLQPAAWSKAMLPLPSEKLDISDLSTELREGIANNNGIESIKRELSDAKEVIFACQESIKDAEKKLKYLKIELDNNHVLVKEYQEFLATAKPVDIEAMERNIAEAETINEQIGAQERNEELQDQVDTLALQCDELSSKLEAIARTKEKALKDAKMPVDGLDFAEGGITYQGMPFQSNQIGSAVRLRVSMAIAMALNPKLRVIRVTDGSLLDDENRKIIEDLARDKDFQVWMEVVSEDGEIGFTIEDGEVVAVDGEKV